MPKQPDLSNSELAKLPTTRQCYTTKEVVAMLGYNRDSFLHFLKKSPKMAPPFIRFGKNGTYRFPIKQFNAWLERRAT